MRVLVAFDKFKDSLTAPEACDVAARTLRGRHPDWEFDLCPLSDGGDGFAEILTRAAGGSLQRFQVSGPRGGLVEAPVGLVPPGKIPAAARELLDVGGNGSVAVIDMASASGLALLPPGSRDPWQASSYGTGQLIRIASELGASAILLGIGGSATNDLGLGALSALGFEFRTAEGAKLRPPIPFHWDQLGRIEGGLFPSIPPIRIACDVSNPLLGPRGAAAVYGPQKGLLPADHERLETATARVAERLLQACGGEPGLLAEAGAGAAGGIAFGLRVAAGARLVPGFELVARWLDLKARLAAAGLVLTGEGRFDLSSTEGKGPGAVADEAEALGREVHVFAGQTEEPAGGRAERIHLHCITPEGMPLPLALKEGRANLAAKVTEVFS